MIKAIIMAGGEGTRLRPLTCNRAKPMIPVMNKPVIEHAIDLLKKHNIKDIIISLFYLPENIQNYFRDGSEWDVNITYSVEETPLGTAGGVKYAIGKNDDTFIVLSGDGIIDFNITEILEFHKKKKSPFTIVLNRVNKPTEYGIVITKEDGSIDKFLEKPAWSEVFSDTANTGMYVIEPKIVNKYIPENTKFDFSMDLFPLLQEKKITLFGYIADGYWCDVGSLQTFSSVHKDILDGLVDIDIPGKMIGKDIWAGKDVEIHPDAKITGPAYIGNYVKVKKDAEISEFSTIGDNCVLEEGSSVRRSIILHSTVIGPKSEIRGAVIGKRCVLQENVSIYEGAVVSDDCRIETGVDIPAGIRVWPDKIIEQGSRLTTDLIWGQTQKKTLFTSDGLTGTFNIEITPEFSAKLGSAIGAFLGKNARITISRDTTSAARLIKRSFTAGLLAMGVDVYDMEIESIPVNKYSTQFVHADLGCYIHISPLTGLQYIQLQLFNKNGFKISLNEEKKIENIFFRGDYPRKNAFETGKLIYTTHHVESYISRAKGYVDEKNLINSEIKIIVDCFHGTVTHIFPELLESFGCETTVLRGQRKTFDEIASRDEVRKAIDNVVQMSKMNREIGAIIGPHGSKITIIDELGNILNDEDIYSILCLHSLKHQNVKTVNIPVNASDAIEKLITDNKGKVNRTSSTLRSPENIIDIFKKDQTECYPYLELEYDPMLVFLQILEYTALTKSTLYEIKEQLPKSNITNIALYCTIEEKAAIMRMLTTTVDQNKIELLDGVKIHGDNAWILILPDASLPLIHVYGEGDSVESRDDMIKEYTVKIKKFQEKPF